MFIFYLGVIMQQLVMETPGHQMFVKMLGDPIVYELVERDTTGKIFVVRETNKTQLINVEKIYISQISADRNDLEEHVDLESHLSVLRNKILADMFSLIETEGDDLETMHQVRQHLKFYRKLSK